MTGPLFEERVISREGWLLEKERRPDGTFNPVQVFFDRYEGQSTSVIQSALWRSEEELQSELNLAHWRCQAGDGAWPLHSARLGREGAARRRGQERGRGGQ